jgi:hypothetical protein
MAGALFCHERQEGGVQLKRIKLIILLLIIVIVISLICVCKYFIEKINDETISNLKNDIILNNQEAITTRLGDTFLFRYQVRNYPHLIKSVSIIDPDSNISIGHFTSNDEYSPELVVALDNDTIRCYEIQDLLIYKVGNSALKSIDIIYLSYIEECNDNDLVEASIQLFNTSEWKWIKACGRLLLSTNDDEIKSTLERYAYGEFTQEELEINKSSVITIEEIQDYIKGILS